MKLSEILEIKKRIEFNLTEPETLIKLIEDAKNKGDKVRKDIRRLRQVSSKILGALMDQDFILTEDLLQNVEIEKTAVGIDGSFQLVGGTGGTWYAPISVARVVFENGIKSKPHVDVFWAGIEEIKESDEHLPKVYAELMMLSGETKCLLNWGTKRKESIVFIDGAIVDPPDIRKCGKDYIKDRCEAITKCLETSNLIGCVKRPRDRFFIEFLTKTLDNSSKYLGEFPNDLYLMAHIFARVRANGYSGTLFTKWIDVSEVNPTYKLYKEHGVYVITSFFQKDVRSKILRVDIPIEYSPSENEKTTEYIFKKCIKAVDFWTYPGQDYPIPIYLAHNKCNIREGCAEVLYEEIMTRSRILNPEDHHILEWLR
ncbi:MAG: hypothetical protein DRP00_00995 [Candidatus Aenigmatarchaeota archaeon]|nr:MAG: hypothetical protein DRP00_00995 [Candidatus Aenigmarchaeota archaeon]